MRVGVALHTSGSHEVDIAEVANPSASARSGACLHTRRLDSNARSAARFIDRKFMHEGVIHDFLMIVVVYPEFSGVFI